MSRRVLGVVVLLAAAACSSGAHDGADAPEPHAGPTTTTVPLTSPASPDRVADPTVTPATGGRGEAFGGLRYDVGEFGYQEHEFVKAVWPSVHDRAVYKQQTEELAMLKTGDIESVKFQSSYMHSQGLMVPVDGELTLVRDEAGEPASILLTAAER